MQLGWGAPQANLSVAGNPLTIDKQTFKTGVGTHANSLLSVDLHKQAKHFHAAVGVDLRPGSPAARVRFKVYGDEKVLWTSADTTTGKAPQTVDVDLTGVQILKFVVEAAGPTIAYDHTDWADATISFSGQAPTAFDPPPAPGDIGILTPPPPATPRINGPKVFGVRPDSPFLYTIPVSGERPIAYSADHLPAGLSVDAATGQITGKAPDAGRYTVTLRARNKLGEVDKPFEIVVGDQVCLTPPMGWNSWNCWGGSVSQDKVLSSATAMVEKGLSQHGWSYVNIDDGWQGVRGGEFKAIQPNKKFPDIKALADKIHAMGLRFGIYSTPWYGTYAGHIGSSCNNEEGTYDWVESGKHDDVFTYSGRSSDHFTNGNTLFSLRMPGSGLRGAWITSNMTGTRLIFLRSRR